MDDNGLKWIQLMKMDDIGWNSRRLDWIKYKLIKLDDDGWKCIKKDDMDEKRIKWEIRRNLWARCLPGYRIYLLLCQFISPCIHHSTQEPNLACQSLWWVSFCFTISKPMMRISNGMIQQFTPLLFQVSLTVFYSMKR